MDTITNMASGAAKYVFGDNNNTTTTTTNEAIEANKESNKMNTATQHQEPVSGKLGDTSKGEPFDAGNIEPTGAQTPGLETSKDPIAETQTGTHTKTPTTESTETGTQSKLPIHGSSGATGTDVRDIAAEKTGTQHKDSTSTTPTNPRAGGPTSDQPSTTGDHGGFKAAQADIRDPDSSATTDPKVEEERKNVDDSSALDKNDNPAKVEGAGPKPIAEVARERGGDAANVGENKSDEKDDDPEGLRGNSESKGTGEQYVKTSGLKADGGDFDATKPGAGREADRLLEEKGIHVPKPTDAGTKPAPDEDSSSPDGKKEKTSLKDKIKAKLHKN